jgi:FtsH-binding integral membrane protein
MANWSDPRMVGAPPAAAGTGTRDVAYDAGLRSYMLSVYNYMASGVLLTGIVALLFANSGMAQDIMFGPGLTKYLIIFSPLVFVLAMNFGINKMSTGTLQMLFWGFAIVMGLSMSTIFLVYTGASIAQTFFATAAAFAGLSLWGYTTKKDLSGMGTFLIMGLVGLIVASIINIFLQSGTMNLVISFVGVLIFAGLTAYDTQKIKSMYSYVAGTDMMGKTVIMGALSLYLDFINMFQFLLSFMGSRD